MFDETIRQELRSRYQSGYLDRNEERGTKTGAFEEFKNQTRRKPLISAADSANIEQGNGNTVAIPVIDNNNITITKGYARTCALQTSDNTSRLVNVTGVRYGFGFDMKPTKYYDNLVGYMEDLQLKITQRANAFDKTLDSDCIADIEGALNQYWTAEVLNYYPQLGNFMQVPDTEKDKIYNKIETIMEQMDFNSDNSPISIIASTSHKPTLRDTQAGNGYNLFTGVSLAATEADRAYTLNDYRWNFSNRVTPETGSTEKLYAIQDGSLYMQNRNDIIFKNGGDKVNDGKLWMTMNYPVVELEMGLFYQRDCADYSADLDAPSESTADIVESFEFSTEVFRVTPYNSDPANRYNPILGFSILNP